MLLAEDKLPTISIITIVFNGVDTLEKTIRSIVNQDYPYIEYLIIDGGSKDGTVDIIKTYQDKIAYWVSEPDKGLYDAMNKGLIRATGDYVWFINSGDQIPEPQLLSSIFSSTINADVIYGDTLMIDSHDTVIGNRRLAPPQNLKPSDFKRGMLVSHQSFIARRSLAPLYDTRYRFSADFEWTLSILEKSNLSVNTHRVLSLFLDGGITKQNIVPGLKERFRIMCEHFGWWSTLVNHIPIAFNFFFYLIKNKRF